MSPPIPPGLFALIVILGPLAGGLCCLLGAWITYAARQGRSPLPPLPRLRRKVEAEEQGETVQTTKRSKL